MTSLDQAAVHEHSLGIRLHHAAAAGANHVPYLKDLYHRMAHPRVGDQVTALTRIPGNYLPHAHGTLLEIQPSTRTDSVRGIIASFLDPDVEQTHRYDSLIALPALGGRPGPADEWIYGRPIPAHMLRCVDTAAATALTGDLYGHATYAERFGRCVIFHSPDNRNVQSIVSSAFEALWATEAEADATLWRAVHAFGWPRLSLIQPTQP